MTLPIVTIIKDDITVPTEVPQKRGHVTETDASDAEDDDGDT